MFYIKCISFGVLVFCSTLAKAQSSYFNSIGIEHSYEPIVHDFEEDTEVSEDSVDTTGTIPQALVDATCVAFPLEKLHLTSPFGVRRDPLKSGKAKMHSGLDLRARFVPVSSMLPGTVVDVGYSKTGGNYVSISHGVCLCSYLHMSKISVKEGSHVSAGDIVGISGNSGSRTTGPHLHISCRYLDKDGSKGKYFNPMLLLEFVSNMTKK